MEKENSYGQMVICMKETGKKIKDMVKETINGIMEIHLVVFGRIIRDMEKELKFGGIKINMKVNGLMMLDKVEEYLLGQMVIFMMVIGRIIKNQDMVYINEQTKMNM